MRFCDLHTDASHIRDALDDLQLAWQQTTADWNDNVSRGFCKQHLEPLGPVVKQSLDAVSRMTQLVDQMYRECES